MNVEIYFNEEIKPIVIKEISKANKEIVAAIAWFNDKEIFETLKSKVEDGVSIDLIISNDPNNFNSPDSLDFDLLINAGVKVNRLITDEKLMHHKFCIIDNHTIITGSYNWTYGGSTTNLENIVLIENDIKNCERFKAEYDRMINTYFRHIDEAVEILEKMKIAISDLQSEIIKNRYLPDKIMENLRKYGAGNFLIDSPNVHNSLAIPEDQIKTIDKNDWWESLPISLQKTLNDKLLKTGREANKPPSDAIDYLLSINEISLNNYNRSVWDRETKSYQLKEVKFYDCEGLEKLPNLKNLDISNNSLNDNGLKGLEKLLGLEKLNISNNNLKTLPLTDYLINLTDLDISRNNFRSIDFISNCPNLKILRCEENRLLDLTGIEKVKKIRFLFLDRKIFELPFIKSNLTELGFVERENDVRKYVKLENEKVT